MGKLRPFVRKDSYMPNKKWIPFVIGNGYTTTDGASGPAPEYETVTGNPVSFNAITPFPLRQLEVAFSPVQDLHGYDAPWPAGGGKNKINVSPTTMTGNGYLIDLSGVAIPAGVYTVSVKPSTLGNVTGASFAFKDANDTSVISSIGNATDAFSTGCTVTLSAECAVMRLYVTISANTTFSEIQLESGNTKTAFAPYSNLCPILGWDSLNVEQSGKNLFDGTYEPLGVSADKIASTNGRTAIVPIKGGEKYTINKLGTSNRSVYYEAYETPTVGTSVVKIGETTIPMTVTTSANAKYLVIYVSTSSEQAEPQMTVVWGETASDYIPYNPSSRSISISIGSTVYSGYVDVVTGVGEVTMAVLDLGGIGNWGYNSSTSMFNKLLPTDAKIPTNIVPANALCEQFAVYSYNALSSQSVGFAFRNEGANSTIRIKDPRYTDPDDFKTAMNGVKLVYELAAPIPIQLTPQEVQSLAGDNTMWTDGDSLTVEYRSN